MTRRSRAIIFAVSALLLTGVLTAALLELPAPGEPKGSLATLIDHKAVPLTGAANIVSAVLFDFRVFDTLLEEMLLFSAVIGTAMLLRPSREESQDGEGSTPEATTSAPELVRAAARPMFFVLVIIGLHVVVHGHVSPGGGFQGGVALATAAGLAYFAGRYQGLVRLAPAEVLQVAEACCVALFLVAGLAPLLARAALFTNMLPDGTPGRALSGGHIPLLNLSVGAAVATGIALLVSEFVKQTDVLRESRSWR